MPVDSPGELPDEAGSLVRPYVMTTGRQPAGSVELDMISVVVAVHSEVDDVSLEPEQASILRLCQLPQSVAEVSAHLALPITVVKVLIADLTTRGYVFTRAPHATESPVSRNLLEAVLDGIQQL